MVRPKAPAPGPAEGAAVARLVHDFVWDYAPAHLTQSEHTLRGYRTTLSLYVGWLASEGVTPDTLRASDLGAKRLEAWLAWLAGERGNSPQTCNVRLSHMRTFLGYASSRDATMCHLSAEGASVPRRKAPKTKVEGISEDAVRALMASPDQGTRAGRRDLALMVFLYSTACRVGEALSLRMSSLRLEGSRPYATIVGKGGKARTLYLPDRAADHVRAYVEEFHGTDPDPSHFLFWSRNHPRGTHQLSRDAVTKLLRKHAARGHEECPDLPCDLTAHRLRHARATHWLDRGVRLAQVSLLLGHASIQTTMDYLDVTIDTQAEAMQSVAGATEVKRWGTDSSSLAGFCGL